MFAQETEMCSMDAFMRSHKFDMTCEHWHENPQNTEWTDADHWRCVLAAYGRSMTVYFSMGYGHGGKEPKAADVLDCLASDASGIENAESFEDWAGDYGYDPDSRKAEKLYSTCQAQAAKLKNLFGEAAYETLLWNTERL